jgi:GNAT superfamily N-acetyltransferase
MQNIEYTSVKASIWYLQMLEYKPQKLEKKDGMQVMRMQNYPTEKYLDLYQSVSVGLSWFERLRISDEKLSQIIHDKDTYLLVLHHENIPIGMIEIKHNTTINEMQIIYFGILETYIGKGIGAFFIQTSLAYAFGFSIQRLHLTTCSFDHPRALAFYQKQGFELYKQGEVDEVIPVGYLPKYL